jgi:hypothetical protein
MKMSTNDINNKNDQSDSYFIKHANLIIILAIIVVPVILVSYLLLPMIKSDHEFVSDMKKHAEDPKESCDNLKLIVSVVGNGIWGIDPVEKDLHDLAQSKLDKGECIK